MTANDCEANLKQSQQRLEKVLDALENAEILIKSLQSEIEKRKELERLNDSIIGKKNEVIQNQQKLIEIYEKQKGLTVSFLFGLIKIRKN